MRVVHILVRNAHTHMSMVKGKAQIVLNDRICGTIRNIQEDLYEYVLPHSTPTHDMLYCPDCGDIWARILYEHGSGWQAHCMKCINCGGVGSLDIFPLFEHSLNNWSRELLLYELTEVNHDAKYSGLWRAS